VAQPYKSDQNGCAQLDKAARLWHYALLEPFNQSTKLIVGA